MMSIMEFMTELDSTSKGADEILLSLLLQMSTWGRLSATTKDAPLCRSKVHNKTDTRDLHCCLKYKAIGVDCHQHRSKPRASLVPLMFWDV